jgi:hypothetical protein
MKETELSINVRLSFQRALWGKITHNIRMITVGWDSFAYLHLRAYFSEFPSEEEMELMDIVCAEVIADLPFEKDNVECIADNRLIKELEVLKEIVYIRKE